MNSTLLDQPTQTTTQTGTTATPASFDEPRTWRPVSEDDLLLLKPHQRKIADILRNSLGFVSSAHLKFSTGTKHAPRRVSEIIDAGFKITVRKNGHSNEYRWEGEVLIAKVDG